MFDAGSEDAENAGVFDTGILITTVRSFFLETFPFSFMKLGK